MCSETRVGDERGSGRPLQTDEKRAAKGGSDNFEGVRRGPWDNVLWWVAFATLGGLWLWYGIAIIAIAVIAADITGAFFLLLLWSVSGTAERKKRREETPGNQNVGNKRQTAEDGERIITDPRHALQCVVGPWVRRGEE